MKFCKVVTKITELLMSFNSIVDEITDSLNTDLKLEPDIPELYERVQGQDFLGPFLLMLESLKLAHP